MRLNLLNQTVIVAAAVAKAGLVNMTPRFGATTAVNERAFKYAVTGDPSNALMIERVSLNELFDNIPQDITGFTFETPAVLVADVHEKLGVDFAVQESPVDMLAFEEIGPEDTLGELFLKWKRVVGLSDLKRSEVDLSSFEDYMFIDARNAVLFKGTVQVKIK